MKIFLTGIAAFAMATPGVAAAPKASAPLLFSKPVQNDVLTRMFVWWNAAFRDPNGFTPAAFGKYFTDDAVMRIDGSNRAKGLDALAARFRMIQGKTTSVLMHVPFVESFSSPDGSKIFTYHVIDAVENGKASHEMVMGYATIRGGKIALINFISIEGQPGPVLK